MRRARAVLGETAEEKDQTVKNERFVAPSEDETLLRLALPTATLQTGRATPKFVRRKSAFFFFWFEKVSEFATKPESSKATLEKKNDSLF